MPVKERAPYSYTISSGALPTGLSLTASSGVILGAPNTLNIYTFTVKANEAKDNSNIYYYTIPKTREDFMAYDGSVIDMREYNRLNMQDFNRYNKQFP